MPSPALTDRQSVRNYCNDKRLWPKKAARSRPVRSCGLGMILQRHVAPPAGVSQIVAGVSARALWPATPYLSEIFFRIALR